jgi:DAK2 domain fusion protein YloV
MAAEVMDGEAVRHWCRLSAQALAQARAAIDALNVFPVPDADTGTNMHITLMAAADAVDALPVGAASADVWQAAARGALLGACGNSGIILSQLLRGLAEVCAPEARCEGEVVARALAHAAASARAAVSRPAEGTVLTVAEAAARAGTGAAGTLAAVVTAAAAAAREALPGTREQLDVLAANGVVDAGAAGLCVLLDALVATVTGAAAEELPVGLLTTVPLTTEPAAGARPARGLRPPAHASYGYEVTYLLEAADGPVGLLRERLDALGESLVIVGGEGLWNVHVHVADAGAAIEEGLLAGRPRRITVTWLGRVVGGPVVGGTGGDGGRAVVAVAEGGRAGGEGIASLLRAGGARVVGNQDGSGPAVPVLADAIRQAGAQVAVVPGSGRAAVLARAAAARLVDEGIKVSVIPASSPLQGIAALAVHDPQRAFGADVAAMEAAAAGMRYGSVIGPGPDGGFTGLDGEEVRVAAGTQRDVASTLTTMLLARGGELLTLMEGTGADPGLARLIADEIGQARPWVEVVRYDGGPVPLLIGVE